MTPTSRGFLVWLAGVTLGVVAAVRGCWRYAAALEEPARETARRRLGQLRSATVAGIEAWQGYDRQAPSGRWRPEGMGRRAAAAQPAS